MKTKSSAAGCLLFLLMIPVPHPVGAQETTFQVLESLEAPAELGYIQDSACRLEFREQWKVNPDRLIIIKEVKEVTVSCENESGNLSLLDQQVRIPGISYEFSFLDPHEVDARELQGEISSLILRRYPGYRMYNLPEDLLSVYFHEEWILEPEDQTFTKIVRGLTPVIWQQRQTVSGEPVDDAETGLPVYFRQELQRIDLRNP